MNRLYATANATYAGRTDVFVDSPMPIFFKMSSIRHQPVNPD